MRKIARTYNSVFKTKLEAIDDAHESLQVEIDKFVADERISHGTIELLKIQLTTANTALNDAATYLIDTGDKDKDDNNDNDNNNNNDDDTDPTGNTKKVNK